MYLRTQRMRVSYHLTSIVALIRETDELAPLRPVRHRMRKEYVEAYFKEVKPSEPGEDYDDRNALYCL